MCLGSATSYLGFQSFIHVHRHRLEWGVVDTTFGPVAEGARRQEVKDSEADANSKHGGGPSSLVFGSEGEDKTPRTLKPMPGASAEVARLRCSSGRNAKTGKDRATPASC